MHWSGLSSFPAESLPASQTPSTLLVLLVPNISIFRNCHCGAFTEGWVKSFTLLWWQWAQLHLCSEHGKVKGHTSVIYYQCELSPALYMGGGGCSRDILRRIGFAVNQSLAHRGFVAEQLYLLSLSVVHISKSLWLPPISFHSSLF